MPATPTIAFVTEREASELAPDDRTLVAPLVARGIAAIAAPWDDPTIDWTAFTAVVVRSPWHYYRRLDDFLAWSRRLEAAGVLLWNPASVLAWNGSKRYLRELEAAGVAIVPTEWIDRGTDPRIVDLPATLARRGWPRAVVKPSISATAYRTVVVAASGDAKCDDSRCQAPLADILRDADALVQPFLPEIPTDGEWSLVYLRARSALHFSHAVVKRPAAGDFRVQDQFGGSIEPRTPAPSLRRQADEIVATLERLLPAPLLFVRIDGVVSRGHHAPAGRFLLMEAELIEPNLYLRTSTDAPARLARAIIHTSEASF